MEKQQVETLVGVLDKRMNRQLKEYLDICVRCAICKDACHQLVGTRDFKFLPARRAELIRQVYQKYFTKTGEFVPALYEARDPDDNLLDELYESMYACTGCRRCMYYCPFSIDTQWVIVGRQGDADRGRPRQRDARAARRRRPLQGRQRRDVPRHPAHGLQGHRGGGARARRATRTRRSRSTSEGADILYVALAGAHSILPAAVIFNEAKESWTLSLLRVRQLRLLLRRPRESAAHRASATWTRRCASASRRSSSPSAGTRTASPRCSTRRGRRRSCRSR